MTRADPQFKLRMPLELKEQIDKAAEENHRSINAEIVARLQSTFDEQRLYGHKLSSEITSEEAKELKKRVEAVEAAMQKMLGDPGGVRRE
ncbi:Arc family DNA-binding protein [Halomonas pacifica]|uniref:Arc family DNA-binding protein n=1 Tax=Bisbaumannia pacifica TaxID=77098 RepID=UPI002358F018|nr:Arc family DNA-binding protein [Halomonas pacifica]MDC8802434.1 Arc family DNA-binding protein [Halomonas pacifica]